MALRATRLQRKTISAEAFAVDTTTSFQIVSGLLRPHNRERWEDSRPKSPEDHPFRVTPAEA